MPQKTNLAPKQVSSRFVGPTQEIPKKGSKKRQELLAVAPSECFRIGSDTLSSYTKSNAVESEHTLKVLEAVDRFLGDAERGFSMKGAIGYYLSDNESDKWQIRLATFLSEAMETDGSTTEETLPGEYVKICRATRESVQLVIRLDPLTYCFEADAMGRASEVLNALYMYAGLFQQSPGTVQDLRQSMKTSCG